jgi:hypothetical protein
VISYGNSLSETSKQKRDIEEEALSFPSDGATFSIKNNKKVKLT